VRPALAAAPQFTLGIDPGLSGSLALLRCEGLKIESIYDMPVTDGRVDAARLALIVGMCQLRGTIVAAVELVSSMPRQAGAFNFGVSAGCVHGVLGALGVPFHLVAPQQWKSSFGLRRVGDESQAGTKARAREIAARLWPDNANLFARVKDADRAEAALIGRFWAAKQGWL
jgi:crossover junction endodeoxyribonuclease RuvC